MENRGRGRLRGVAVLAALAAVAVTAAASTGSSAASTKAGSNPFAHYGKITLNVWSADNQDPGPEPVIKALAAVVLEEVPERHDQAQVLRLHELHQGHQALAQQRQRARCRRGQPGLPDRLRARQGEADPAARQLCREVRLEQAVLRRHGAAVPLDAGRQDLRQGHPLGRRPVRAVGRRVLQQGARQEVRRRIPTPCRRRSPTSASCSPRCARTRRRSVPIINIGNKDGYESLHAFGMVQGAYVTRPVRAQLDLPRPGQHLGVAGQPQGDDAVPAVVQGQLLRQ